MLFALGEPGRYTMSSGARAVGVGPTSSAEHPAALCPTALCRARLVTGGPEGGAVTIG